MPNAERLPIFCERVKKIRNAAVKESQKERLKKSQDRRRIGCIFFILTHLKLLAPKVLIQMTEITC